MQINRITNNLAANSIASSSAAVHSAKPQGRQVNVDSTLERGSRDGVLPANRLVVQDTLANSAKPPALINQQLFEAYQGTSRQQTNLIRDSLPLPVRQAVDAYSQTGKLDETLGMNRVLGFDAYA